MLKRKAVSLAIVLSTLTIGMTAYAANCPQCEQHGTTTNLIVNAEHLSSSSYNHTVRYSSNGVLYNEPCTVTIQEERISWSCPVGHGIVSTRIRHKDNHSNDYCIDLDYYK